MTGEPPSPLQSLAIVIPAFRQTYLAETLASIAAQTDRRFHVYVADDGSPEPLEKIVAPFRSQFNLTYRRFDDNLAIPGLTRHWHRAIALSGEPWIWLFSDDDLMTPDCVAAIHRQLALAPEATSLLRFDVDFIDERSAFLHSEASFPPALSAKEYAFHLLAHPKQPCMIQNIVFPRSVYVAEHGFASTIGGYSTDSATWPRFARSGGVRRLPSGKVRFRYHGASVGARIAFYDSGRRDAMEAYRLSIRAMRSVATEAEFARPEWLRAELTWFAHWFRYLPRPLRADERKFLATVMADLWPRHGWLRRWYFWRNYSHLLLRQAVHRSRWLSSLHRRLVRTG
jgi:glycosyltransferase involved in cell wall biosynthesis